MIMCHDNASQKGSSVVGHGQNMIAMKSFGVSLTLLALKTAPRAAFTSSTLSIATRQSKHLICGRNNRNIGSTYGQMMSSQSNMEVDKSNPKRLAKEIMQNFSTRTGLTSDGSKDLYTRRYLWTDAFAVANYFQLAQDFPEEEQFHATALHLIESVHESLGKFRQDDKNGRSQQWLSGSSRHPTAAGLRIGKPLDEKGPEDSYDSDKEWDQDGQYFHYLTKWMTALEIAAQRTGRTEYITWALDLMKVAAEKFVYHDLGRPQMYWKMSIDLTRPQVMSQGASDPIDGYITTCRLLSTCDKLNVPAAHEMLPKLFEAKSVFYSMVHMSPSDDPLGLGGMLLDIYHLEKLQQENGNDNHNTHLLRQLHRATLQGLEYFSKSGELSYPAKYRLAFREFGLSIGLHKIEGLLLDQARNSKNVSSQQQLAPFFPLARQIESFWLDPTNQAATTWKDHLDINQVMLATSLNSEAWL